MNEKVYNALSEQITHEFFSSNLYLSIASYFENIPLEGMAKWFLKQAQEEREHGMKIYDYLLERNLHVNIGEIGKTSANFSSVLEAFEAALHHEKKVTGWIHYIYELAIQEKDHATAIFLQWFITEQVEEEKNATDNVDYIKLIGDDKGALLVLDQEFRRKAS